MSVILHIIILTLSERSCPRFHSHIYFSLIYLIKTKMRINLELGGERDNARRGWVRQVERAGLRCGRIGLTRRRHGDKRERDKRES